MRAAHLRPGADDIIVGIDLAAREHQVVIVEASGRRLTRFRVSHSREGLAELVRRSSPERWQAAGCLFAFEATGHVWEAVAAHLEAAGCRYVTVNPLATFRLREARSMDRTKTDLERRRADLSNPPVTRASPCDSRASKIPVRSGK